MDKAARQIELPRVSGSVGKLNVLVLEDDVLIQEIFQQIIERHGYLSTICADIESARKILADAAYDLVLLDINPPKERELELIPEIRLLMPKAEIITMTGSNTMALEKKVRAWRVAYHLIKPFELEELVSLLNHIATRKLLGLQQKNMEEES